MEIMQLRYFLEVAETQHMTLSAENLHIAQPALSQTIKRLENEMGVPLFRPKGRNIVLTEYGTYLQAQLLPVFERLDNLPGELQTMAKLSAQTVHLNVLAASSLVTDAIIAYKSTQPNLNFQLLQNTQNDIFDIEITSYMQHNRRTENQFICEEKIYLAVDRKKFGECDSIMLADLQNAGFISLMGSKQFRTICDRYCKQIGFRPKVTFESDNVSAVKNMIGAGLGVGFWPEFTWGEVDHDNIKLLEIADIPFRRDIVITYRKNKADNRNVEDFFTFLTAYFAGKRKI